MLAKMYTVGVLWNGCPCCSAAVSRPSHIKMTHSVMQNFALKCCYSYLAVTFPQRCFIANVLVDIVFIRLLQKAVVLIRYLSTGFLIVSRNFYVPHFYTAKRFSFPPNSILLPNQITEAHQYSWTRNNSFL